MGVLMLFDFCLLACGGCRLLIEVCERAGLIGAVHRVCRPESQKRYE